MPGIEKSEKPVNIINNKRIIIAFAILITLILAIVWFLKITDKDNLSLEVYVPIPEASMDVGVVGNLEEGKTLESVNPEAIENPVRPLDMPVPRDIFHTSGTITAIQANSVIIKGIGTNFDDQMKRDLTVVINESTTVNGVKGNLEHFKKSLKVGDKISIEAPYNIHGKTEFLARYINTINND
ncbi:MAG: hypothetical protein PHY30_01000 [Candidatus Pacebacteria bacterium]|nr:hypothetical protein [Candidatus Paceibacterota bacterium]